MNRGIRWSPRPDSLAWHEEALAGASLDLALLLRHVAAALWDGMAAPPCFLERLRAERTIEGLARAVWELFETRGTIDKKGPATHRPVEVCIRTLLAMGQPADLERRKFTVHRAGLAVGRSAQGLLVTIEDARDGPAPLFEADLAWLGVRRRAPSPVTSGSALQSTFLRAVYGSGSKELIAYMQRVPRLIEVSGIEVGSSDEGLDVWIAEDWYYPTLLSWNVLARVGIESTCARSMTTEYLTRRFDA